MQSSSLGDVASTATEKDLLEIQPNPHTGLARKNIEEMRGKLATLLPSEYTTNGILGFGNSSIAWHVKSSLGNNAVFKMMTDREMQQSHSHAHIANLAYQLSLPVGKILHYGSGWCLEEMVPGSKLTSDDPNHPQICHELGANIARLHGASHTDKDQMRQFGIKDFDIQQHREKTYMCKDKVVTKVGIRNWERMVAALERFTQVAINQEEFVPCHADITPDNLFVDKGHLSGIIDFGSGMMGPRERDFASIMRMEIMGVTVFPFYQQTKVAYERITGYTLNEELVKGITLFKCMRKIVKWENSPEKMIKALKYLLGNDFREEEINPLWGKE